MFEKINDNFITKNLHVSRQVIATFAACLLSMTSGFTFGYTGVLLPQLKTDKDFPYDEYLDSWIASISPLAMTVGCIFAGVISDGLGRKTGQLFITPFFVLGWFAMGFAKNNNLILLGRVVTGLCTGAVRPSTMVYIGEITSPKYRSITLVSPTLAVHIGAMTSHVVGKVFHWRTSCFLFGIPNILCFIILIFLKESPLWLLNKGKMEEGLRSFKLFRGEDEAAEKELKSILDKKEEKSEETTFKDLLNIIFSRMFMKALVTIFFLFCTGQLSGVNTISFYALDMFEDLFGKLMDPYKLTLIIDFLRIVVALLMCLFINRFPRRKTFLICCFATTIVLIALSVFFFIKPPGLSILCLIIFITYVCTASTGTSLIWPFIAEIFPSNLRGFGSGLGSAMCFILLFVAVKVVPGILESLGDSGMFMTFSASLLISSVILCFMLPETSGKSLQEIENDLYGNKDEKSTKSSSKIHVTRV